MPETKMRDKEGSYATGIRQGVKHTALVPILHRGNWGTERFHNFTFVWFRLQNWDWIQNPGPHPRPTELDSPRDRPGDLYFYQVLLVILVSEPTLEILEDLRWRRLLLWTEPYSSSHRGIWDSLAQALGTWGSLYIILTAMLLRLLLLSFLPHVTIRKWA